MVRDNAQVSPTPPRSSLDDYSSPVYSRPVSGSSTGVTSPSLASFQDPVTGGSENDEYLDIDIVRAGLQRKDEEIAVLKAELQRKNEEIAVLMAKFEMLSESYARHVDNQEREIRGEQI